MLFQSSSRPSKINDSLILHFLVFYRYYRFFFYIIFCNKLCKYFTRFFFFLLRLLIVVGRPPCWGKRRRVLPAKRASDRSGAYPRWVASTSRCFLILIEFLFGVGRSRYCPEMHSALRPPRVQALQI